MWRVTSPRKLVAISAVLLWALALLTVSHVLPDLGGTTLAQAQDGQPPGTVELFKPFWEAWGLLHENYVDPLDDGQLIAGALHGLLSAVDVAAMDIEPPPLSPSPADNAERFAPFWATWQVLHDRYGAALDDDVLMQGALRGMVAAIGDPHTDYMDPETFARVNEGMSGEYEGIGATVQKNDITGGLELITIFDGSPAATAGLRPGDHIVRVEGQDVTALTQNEIIALVRGPADTLVRLGILRPNEPDILKFEVRRGRILVPSVSSRLIDGAIGYIRLSQFEFSTSQEMRQALQELNANDLDGLVLDLRGNPGGYLTTSIEVASAYLPEGIVLIERGPDREIEHPVLGNADAPDVPMVVLVDQGSASASELIAGALQDHHRATIVGIQTFGKGSVQTWRELSNGGGIRITISRWYTPDGNSVSEQGIHPDIIVPYDPESISEDLDNQLAAAVQVLRGTYSDTAQAAPAEATAAAE